MLATTLVAKQSNLINSVTN